MRTAVDTMTRRLGAAALVTALLAGSMLLSPVASADGPVIASPTPDPTAQLGQPPVAMATSVVRAPRLVGTARVGHHLGVRTGLLAHGVRVGFQWFRVTPHGRRAVSGADRAVYLIRATDRGHRLGVVVTYSGDSTTPTLRWSQAEVVGARR